MSRIGKKPIEIPKGVTISLDGQTIKVKGPKGELHRILHHLIKTEIVDNEIKFSRPDDLKETRSLHGLTRALVQNMIVGVTDSYKKSLEIVGVGYKAELKGKNLLLNIGYSHPIYFVPPDEVKLEVPAPTQINISGNDKELVGLVAAKIRSFRKPEPYKGKGIKYSDERIIRKAGKTAGA
ncbi:MAG: 50S ribosomal protein L6 [Ignavibacteriota bacterium]|nr:MAG: 50S ribosomal protein L6 [Chlorobiota bacterium]MBE7476961.1 50S ribosomal protein L6 [Ignavibacteriales bacterium]MBL1121789.1 50S ribosomal protein L6 [Ignavibacteriota bacterium]MBV6419852.1 50S ribosomal protein L6 [Ignavibacteriaceae bacterium]MCE7855321.1 50S ribosomal protein L6 [Ignavibacteria bacterium CHB3]MEB2295616.1 50S ribosomal protein L6 [Ignavibacteria bacterium]